MSRNLPASIRARLKQHADAAKEDFNLTLTHFGLESLRPEGCAVPKVRS